MSTPSGVPTARRSSSSRGAGETCAAATSPRNPWFELVRVKASGGEPEPITRVNGDGGPPADRPRVVRAGRTNLLSRTEGRAAATPGQGGDSRSRTSSRSDPTAATGAPISSSNTPTSRAVARRPVGRVPEGDNVYLTPFPLGARATTPVKIDKRRGKLPVTQVSKEGGLFPRWRDNDSIEFGSGPRHFIYDVGTKKTDETAITLSVPRRIPKGSIALTNARIITMENKQVIESGTVVVRNGRIACVGQCSTVRHRAGDRREGQDDHPRLRGHARAPPSRARRDPARARLGDGHLPRLRRDDEPRQLDVVAEHLSRRRSWSRRAR